MADEDEPKRKKRYELGQELADLSIDELKEVQDELRAEIERLGEAVTEKTQGKNAADAFFRK